jgi:hypothetical protein
MVTTSKKKKYPKEHTQIDPYDMSEYKCTLYDEYNNPNECIECTKKNESNGNKEIRCPWEWIKYKDTEVDANYWYNPVTGEASWISPTDMNDKPFQFNTNNEPQSRSGGKPKKSNKKYILSRKKKRVRNNSRKKKRKTIKR